MGLQIFVLYPGGILELDKEDSDSIQGMRIEIQSNLPQYPDITKIVLKFNGQIFEDGFQLKDYGLLKGSTILLTYTQSYTQTNATVTNLTIILIALSLHIFVYIGTW